MGKAEWGFAVYRVGTGFAAPADGGLDKGMFPGSIEIRIDVTKKMTGT